MTKLTKLTALIVLAVFISGCAAGRAFRRGEQRADQGDWDTAVAYLREAVQKAPERPDYRIALERAMLNASRQHIVIARELEAKDQLDAALVEWRRASEFDPANRQAAAKVLELDRIIRERIEASRPRPPIEQLRQEARQARAEPILNPASREPLVFNFVQTSVRDILTAIATLTGINILYDAGFADRAFTIRLDGVTLETALRQVLTANNLFYKVLDPQTIIVVPDNAANRGKYDEQAIQTFYVSHADVQALTANINNLVRIAGLAVPPVLMFNAAANTITVRATTTLLEIIERVIEANDKPRAEIVIDVEILEVNRQRAKAYGIDLSQYAIETIFSPETAPGATGTRFNLNTISQGVSTADFYLGVPSAILRFLESDSTTRLLAKPQLRGAEGTRLTLALGEDIPVLSTTYTPIAAGGAATNPLTNYTYRPVGINLDITPRVTYEGDILIELGVESSSRGADVNVGGTNAPTFSSRRVTTKLRLRDGESNLLAGLLREDERRSVSGLPGLIRVPGLRSLFALNDNLIQQTDIVMLLTPRVIRTHELTQQDLSPIFIGSQGSLGLSGPPPLIAAPEPDVAPAAPPAGAPPALPVPVVPPGSSPIPGTTVPTPQAAPTTPPQGPPPPGAVAPPVAPPQPPPLEPGQPLPAPAAPGPTPQSTAKPPAGMGAAQILVSTPGPELRVAGGPYNIPISVAGASRLSTVSLTMTFNPQALRVRIIQEGSFMRQGGANATFAQQVDPMTGRIDITVTRAGDVVGASGTGLLAVVLFDAIAAGASTLGVSGVAAAPEGTPIPLTFLPASVVVR